MGDDRPRLLGVGGDDDVMAEARELARPHLASAIKRLVEIMHYGQRQAHAARLAAKDIVDIATQLDQRGVIESAVRARLNEMMLEAKRKFEQLTPEERAPPTDDEGGEAP
jgi:hypothetical protein